MDYAEKLNQEVKAGELESVIGSRHWRINSDRGVDVLGNNDEVIRSYTAEQIVKAVEASRR